MFQTEELLLYETLVLNISTDLTSSHTGSESWSGFLLLLGPSADHLKVQVKAICKSNALAES